MIMAVKSPQFQAGSLESGASEERIANKINIYVILYIYICILFTYVYIYIYIQTTPARIYRANMMKLDAIELLSHTHLTVVIQHKLLGSKA
jgi:preprotein translocase subunit SecY